MIYCAIAAGAVLTVVSAWLLFARLPAVIRAALERWRK
jgi:hypothetical protein